MSAPKEMTPQQLHDALAKVQEAKGYYFACETDMVLEILQQMLDMKKRYGYLVCPCRLSSGNREIDRDIMCPCQYRDEDVKEHGFCYCGLYTDEERRKNSVPRVPVPERRPVEKSMAALGASLGGK
ncbi:ferredoxin:thioredoxin reductase [Desulfovibrio sp. OttesenSCG-928-C06]|nr:ferredoxin:thioredoxin reductase [Desulfovibrio sp. OttesenSCG-928-C06]